MTRVGLSQEDAAALMGIDYGTFRQIASGHRELSPYYLCRFMSALPVTTATEDVRVAAMERLHWMEILLAGAAMTQYRRSARSMRSDTWKTRPLPCAPPCEVKA